jgi:uncharacterized membrane protein SirB2
VIEFYPQIKLVHIVAVFASGTVFLLRGLGVQLGQQWPLFAPVRYLSYTIDTVLLTAAFMLMTVSRQYPFVQSWLTVKVLLIVLYIVIGVFALRRGRTPKVRLISFIAALAIFAFVISIARAHHPLGVFVRVLS